MDTVGGRDQELHVKLKLMGRLGNRQTENRQTDKMVRSKTIRLQLLNKGVTYSD